jgi:hypothetical protein
MPAISAESPEIAGELSWRGRPSQAKRKHRVTMRYPMFSGGEKNLRFHCRYRQLLVLGLVVKVRFFVL